MKNERTLRTAMMLGEGAVSTLAHARVAIFGVGGVGGYAMEALARAGVGTLTLVDHDRVSESNINRQIIALSSTVGMLKTDAAKARIADISPDTKVICRAEFFAADKLTSYDFSSYDYVVDAIDSVGSKLELIAAVKAAGTPIISAMGAGNKLDPTLFRVADISKTEVCPLARAVRVGLRKRGINHLKVVYSTEKPCKLIPDLQQEAAPGSVSFVPSVMGLIMAGEVIKDLCGIGAEKTQER